MTSSARFQQRTNFITPPFCPPWLTDPVSQKYLYVMGLMEDLLLEKMYEAMTAKLPGYGPSTAIPLMADDRVMVQGPAEPTAGFTVRLQGAFQAWQRAGSRGAVMGQVQGFLTDLQPQAPSYDPEIAIVSSNNSTAVWDVLTFGAPQGSIPARTPVSPENWNWDGTFKPWRTWMIFYMVPVATGQSGGGAIVASSGGSGVAGVTNGFATITGLSGMTSTDTGMYLMLSGAASSGNNTATSTYPGFQISSVPSSSSVIVANVSAHAGDANNGAISWSVSGYPFLGPAPVVGSAQSILGSGSWGIDATPGLGISSASNLLQSIRQVVRQWKSASTWYDKFIVSFGGGSGTAGFEFSPLSSSGAGNPDGTWGGSVKIVNGGYTQARLPLNQWTSFCDGTAISVECSSKNVT